MHNRNNIIVTTAHASNKFRAAGVEPAGCPRGKTIAHAANIKRITARMGRKFYGERKQNKVCVLQVPVLTAVTDSIHVCREQRERESEQNEHFHRVQKKRQYQ